MYSDGASASIWKLVRGYSIKIKQGDYPLSSLYFHRPVRELFLEVRCRRWVYCIYLGRRVYTLRWHRQLRQRTRTPSTLLDVLSVFCRAAGMRPNPKKCEGCVVYNDKPWPARWASAWNPLMIPLRSYIIATGTQEAKLGLRVAWQGRTGNELR
jgi:hypothetical protein